VERHNYGKDYAKAIAPADLKWAYFADDEKTEIALKFDQPMLWSDALTSQFYLDGEEGKIASGTAAGKMIVLKLTAATTARTITWTARRGARKISYLATTALPR
jgi:hypothetical protein